MSTSFISVIQRKEFRNLWLGQIISQISLNMLSFVLAIHVYSQTHSNTAVSIMLLMFGIPSILFGIVAGGLVDRFDKRKILLFCNTTRAILLLGFYFFAHQNIIFVYILIVIISVITQLFIPAEAPSIPLLVGKEQLLTANSLFTISYYLSTVGGFILAGPALRLFGGDFVFLVMAGFMFLASYFVYRLPKLAPQKISGEVFRLSTVFATIKDGVVFIKNNQRIKDSLYLMTFAQALIATLSVLAPGFADRILSIELTDASFLVLGPAAVGLIIGAYLVGGLGGKVLKGTLILQGIIATGITLILLSLITRGQNSVIHIEFFQQTISISYLIIAIVLLISLGIWNSFISVPANTILQGDSNKEVRGRVYGVLTSATGGVSLIPVLFSGILADALGVGKALAILGFGILVIGMYQLKKRHGGFVSTATTVPIHTV